MKPTVGMSMKETLQFEGLITNPAGIEWVIGSGADVGSDLYMVAPVASAPGPSALYELDPATGQATILGALGVVDPTDIAWDKDGSMMYLIDNDSDALYTVRQIQAPSPSAPVTPGDATGSYLPNAGDLYYNGGNFADAFLRWDNPKWVDGDGCGDVPLGVRDIHCSTYEHDLELNRSWFQALNPIPGAREFCTTWSDIPLFYDDCPTAGTLETEDKIVLSFGTFKANLIDAGQEYYGYWIFHHQTSRTSNFKTPVRLLSEEGRYRGCATIWCIIGIGGHQAERVATTWNRGTSSYVHYPIGE